MPRKFDNKIHCFVMKLYHCCKKGTNFVELEVVNGTLLGEIGEYFSNEVFDRVSLITR